MPARKVKGIPLTPAESAAIKGATAAGGWSSATDFIRKAAIERAAAAGFPVVQGDSPAPAEMPGGD